MGISFTDKLVADANFGSLLTSPSTTPDFADPKLSKVLPRKTQQNIGSDSTGIWNDVFRYGFKIVNASPINGAVTDTRVDRIDNEVLLLIPPSNISITTHFASGVIATNAGVLEENNGVVFRTITIAGTTGVAPLRSPVITPSGGFAKVFKSVLPEANAALNSLVNKVKSLVGKPSDPAKEVKISETGYFQFWKLHNFFVIYAESKKSRSSGDIRLVFESPKDNIAYVCTPVTFDLRRDADRPLQYRYSIVLRAWDLATSSIEAEPIDVLGGIPTPDNVGIVKAITNKIKDARSVIQGGRNVLQAVHSDFNSIMGVYTQATLVLKETAGLVEDIRDFPTILSNNAAILLSGSTSSAIAAFNTAISGKPGSNIGKIPFTSTDEQSVTHLDKAGEGSLGGKLGTGSSGVSTPLGAKVQQNGETRVAQNSRLGVATGALQNALKSNDALLDSPLDQITLPPHVEDQINAARQKAKATTANDVRLLANNLKAISDNQAVNFGMMDPLYAHIFGLPAPVPSDHKPTEDDILVAVALEASRTAFLSTLATGQLFKERSPDPFVAANASLSEDDQVPSPVSAFPVPFERGSSLDTLAQKYLGDAQRSREIVILNGLRAPYVDEDGFNRSIKDASGRTFVVTDRSDLAIGQKVKISGTGVLSTDRRILALDPIGGTDFRVAVDGPANLATYAPGTAPSIHTRIPGTVGSGDTVLIPSTLSSSEPIVNRPTPLLSRLSHAEKVFKIDVALDASGRDIAIDSGGDAKRSVGYDNAAQALRLMIETEQGELERHVEYGLPTGVGERTSDFSIRDFEQVVRRRVTSDPRFRDADVSALLSGNVSRVAVTAHGAKGTGLVPVEFEVGSA